MPPGATCGGRGCFLLDGVGVFCCLGLSLGFARLPLVCANKLSAHFRLVVKLDGVKKLVGHLLTIYFRPQLNSMV